MLDLKLVVASRQGQRGYGGDSGTTDVRFALVNAPGISPGALREQLQERFNEGQYTPHTRVTVVGSSGVDLTWDSMTSVLEGNPRNNDALGPA